MLPSHRDCDRGVWTSESDLNPVAADAELALLVFHPSPAFALPSRMKKLGTGHGRQISFLKTPAKHRHSSGGVLRNLRAGRRLRPLSSKAPLHLVFKARREKLHHRSLRAPQNYLLVTQQIQKYAKRFYVKVEQLSIQGDHIHLLIRTSRRSQFQYFFRVVAGQISQQMSKRGFLVTGTPERSVGGRGLWRYRPFTRIVQGYRAYRICRDYIQLNEKEAQGKIPYQKARLRGLSNSEWEELWA